jgi:hypothetical protein
MLIAGVSFAPFQFPSSNLPHLDSAWLDSTRNFLAHSRSQIIIPSLPSPKPFRQYDQIIMDMVLRLSLSAGQVKKINYCRLFLQVTRLSEITNLEGNHIDPTAWTGSTRLQSHHDWPRQGHPGSRTWALWRNAITDAFCQQPDERVRLKRPGLLDLPLGSWLPGSRPFQLARWTAFLHPISNQLYLSANLPNEATSFQVVNPMDRRTTQFMTYDTTASIEPDLPGHLLPNCAIPVETTPQGAFVKISKIRTHRNLPTHIPPPPPDSFKDYCLQRPPWEQQLIAHSRQLPSTISLSDCLTQGVPLYFCTDGGALHHVGSIGWVIATEDETLWDCTGSALGWNANSFRSEGLSHLSLLVFIQSFLDFHELIIHKPIAPTDTARPRRRPWIRAATDNQGLLTRIDQAIRHISSPFPSDGLRAEYDIISGIMAIVLSLHFTIHWEHVKGHQDDVLPYDQLTRMERLNILADAQVSLGLEYAVATRTVDFITPSIVELRVNNTTITSHYATHLREAAGSQEFFLWYSTN